MKRYLVFAFDEYYPSSGWGDFVTAFDDLEDARKYAKACTDSDKGGKFVWRPDSSEIVDLETMTEVQA